MERPTLDQETGNLAKVPLPVDQIGSSILCILLLCDSPLLVEGRGRQARASLPSCQNRICRRVHADLHVLDTVLAHICHRCNQQHVVRGKRFSKTTDLRRASLQLCLLKSYAEAQLRNNMSRQTKSLRPSSAMSTVSTLPWVVRYSWHCHKITELLLLACPADRGLKGHDGIVTSYSSGTRARNSL